ncbi:predicted protein [Pyrenophora tritici-repentis Pt-1C-BFP]|uniref:Uncharacterized protein n=1 Tax=Pyrenophora tritici-repentis (strain Pt-1C-BFP) TaxID=426418 RepID=B2W239_PYRTR|nr:uncharacterized protein PTRG_03487 [Pyrenophora tritici-repentis Pt-1C-BFP]EDU46325.1 predicted protein [Pyrenophora tritici-repentis Pt-1C-BFP]
MPSHVHIASRNIFFAAGGPTRNLSDASAKRLVRKKTDVALCGRIAGIRQRLAYAQTRREMLLPYKTPE